MSREVKDGDKIMVTKFSGRELDVPHLATVADALRIPSVFILENEINGSDVIFKDVPDCDVWFPMYEYDQESSGSSFWEAGSREVEVGDKITVSKYNGDSVQRDAEVTEVNTVTIDVQFCDRGEEAVLYKHPSELDEWHFPDADISLDASSYEDDAITPSYSEFINSGRGRTLTDYTGVEITEESLDFEPKEEEILRGITAESLNFEEAPKSDAVNHPSHYNYGDIEVIDFIEQVTQQYEDGFDAYIVGNALKYLARSPHKNGLEDVRKAVWYLERLIRRNEDE